MYGFYTNYLDTEEWFSDKIWSFQKELNEFGTLDTQEHAGQFRRGPKIFDWSLKIQALDKNEALYQIVLTLSWNEGNRTVSTSRAAYLLPLHLKEYNVSITI